MCQTTILFFNGKKPQSVEIVSVGRKGKVDKSLNTYLTIYKGMTKTNVSSLILRSVKCSSILFNIFFGLLVIAQFLSFSDYRKEKIVAQFSCCCWAVLLRLDSKLQG